MDLRRIDRIPGVASVMTPFPFAVDVAAPVTAAVELMEEHDIRHVPVEEDGEIVGVVTHRDVALLTNPALPASDRARIHVGQICHRDPYVVDLHAPLDRVAHEMAARHIGSAIVVREGKLAGIFTVTDACRLLGDIFAARFRGGGDEAA
jgi:acetoin utilization protein AcuB